MRISCIIPVFFLILVSGCAFTPQTVVPKPEVNISNASTGQGRSVFVTVVDKRPDKLTIGARSLQGRWAGITQGGDLADILRSSISEGLQRQGFTPISMAEPGSRELRVEIGELSYAINQTFWSAGLHVQCVLKATSSDGSAQLYEQSYRGVHEENIGFIPTKSESELYVNVAVSKAVNAVLQDQKLIRSLAQ